MSEIDDPQLSALVVWQPKAGGRESDVPEATATFSAARARHFWDGQGWTVEHYKRVLGISVDAWDLYLLYGPDAEWNGTEPPQPMFWMHQLWGVDNGPPLDADVFGKRVLQALASPAP